MSNNKLPVLTISLASIVIVNQRHTYYTSPQTNRFDVLVIPISSNCFTADILQCFNYKWQMQSFSVKHFLPDAGDMSIGGDKLELLEHVFFSMEFNGCDSRSWHKP